MIDFDTFKKMPKNVRDLGKLIVTKDFIKLPKVQWIAQFGHTVNNSTLFNVRFKVDNLTVSHI